MVTTDFSCRRLPVPPLKNKMSHNANLCKLRNWCTLISLQATHLVQLQFAAASIKALNHPDKPASTPSKMIRAVNNLCRKPQTNYAGVSNFDLSELSELWLMANVNPAVVQRYSDLLNPDTLVQQYARLTGMQYQVGINAILPHMFICTSGPRTVWMTCITHSQQQSQCQNASRAHHSWHTKMICCDQVCCLAHVKPDIVEAADVHVRLPGILACRAIPCIACSV